MARVELKPRARKDPEEIWDYLAPRNIRSARGMFQSFANKLRLLEDMPEMGALRHGRHEPFRLIVSGRYNILYRYAGGVVTVLRIVHGAQNVKRLEGL